MLFHMHAQHRTIVQRIVSIPADTICYRSFGCCN